MKAVQTKHSQIAANAGNGLRFLHTQFWCHRKKFTLMYLSTSEKRKKSWTLRLRSIMSDDFKEDVSIWARFFSELGA